MKSSAGIYLRWDSRIRLRDGICLSANVYLPRGEADPAPCLFMLTPYTAARSHLRARYFAEQGYIFLVVDARGRGNSDGVFRPFIQAYYVMGLEKWPYADTLDAATAVQLFV